MTKISHFEITNNWEVIGYLKPTFHPPVSVRVIVRDKRDPEKWFYRNNPDIDIRSDIETKIEKDKYEEKFGNTQFIKLQEPIKCYPHTLCILPSHKSDEIIQTSVMRDDLEELTEVMSLY